MSHVRRKRYVENADLITNMMHKAKTGSTKSGSYIEVLKSTFDIVSEVALRYLCH